MTAVTCNNSDAKWEQSSEPISLTDAVDIWRIQVTPNLPLLHNLEVLLQHDEYKSAFRFHQLKDKERFIISRGALRILLGRYLSIKPDEIQFSLDENKKPFVHQTGKVKLHFNVSHSGDWILIAIGNSNLGVDIEETGTGFTFNEVLSHSFSSREINYVQQSPDPERLFYKLWTRKEALTKALSKGLDEDLPAIPSLDGTHHLTDQIWEPAGDWIVSSFEINEKYTGSVARRPGYPLRFWDFSKAIISNANENPPPA